MKRLFAPERAIAVDAKAVTPVSAPFPDYASSQWQGESGAKVWILQWHGFRLSEQRLSGSPEMECVEIA